MKVSSIILKWMLPGLAIILLVTLVYSPILKNDFINNWDEDETILNNEDIRGFSYENVKNWFTQGYVAMYKPVTMATYAINYKLGELEPFGYHLFNLCIYILTIFLLWRFLVLFIKTYWPSIIITLFFALHPFAVESVAWSSGRTSLLAFFFMLVVLNLYVTEKKNFLVLLIFYLLAILSKITAFFLPLFLLVVDIVQKENPFTRKNLISKLILILIATPILIYSLMLRDPAESIGIWESVKDSPAKVFWYINHVFPVYEYAPIYNMPKILDWRNLLSITLILITYLFYNRSSEENKKLILSGGLIFLISLLPHLKQYSVGSPVGDRYGFVAFLGIAIILIAIYNHLSRSMISRSIFIVVIGTITIFHAQKTYSYCKDWKGSYFLWNHTTKVIPTNSIAHAKLGEYLFRFGDYQRARKELEKAVELDPNNNLAYFNLGSLCYYMKSYDEALNFFTKAYELNGDKLNLLHRARIYLLLNENEKVLNEIEQYMEDNPDVSANAYYMRGISKINLGMEGCPDLQAAIDLGMTDIPQSYLNKCNTGEKD